MRVTFQIQDPGLQSSQLSPQSIEKLCLIFRQSNPLRLQFTAEALLTGEGALLPAITTVRVPPPNNP